MVKKLIKSILSLVFALFLCVGVGYAWFSINDTVEVNNLMLTVISDEGGSIAFSDDTSSVTSSLLPNKQVIYNMVTSNEITTVVMDVTQTNPSTYDDFATYFSTSNNVYLLLGEYYKNYYDENDDLIESYLYDISQETTENKIKFLYTFLENNLVSEFLKVEIKKNGDSQLSTMTYNSSTHQFSADLSLKAEEQFDIYVTFGNGERVSVDATSDGDNLTCEYVCNNYNCFLLSSIQISFSNSI